MVYPLTLKFYRAGPKATESGPQETAQRIELQGLILFLGNHFSGCPRGSLRKL